MMRACLQFIPDDTRRVIVGYSGGLDSSVLLHLLVSNPSSYQFIPCHINHGLLTSAADMEAFCSEQSKGYGLELIVKHLKLGDVGSNIEAKARRQRYCMFEQVSGYRDCVVTAHHANDQAESFLLNAMRGSGSAGLRGIARKRMLGNSILLRPLLPLTRKQLEHYAVEHKIKWIDDPSNKCRRFDRNFLRESVIPVINRRWPHFQRSVNTVCELQSDAQFLLDELAGMDYQNLKRARSQGISTLDKSGLCALSPPRGKNLVRYWISRQNLPVISHRRLHELWRQLDARVDALPEISMPGYAIRLYDERLFLVTPQRRSAHRGKPGRLNRVSIFQQLGINDDGQTLTPEICASGW